MVEVRYRSFSGSAGQVTVSGLLFIGATLRASFFYDAGLRVNAIAPGFFVGEQNRALLLGEDNTLTARGQSIIDHTPAGRFGVPDDLIGTLIWLRGPGASFINGIVVPVDGGFGAFSGM
jgi:NAD(P)-dependent dehydrogenase (short-subunit alcohol dehydrogenase family)